jgi:hypothetical protein
VASELATEPDVPGSEATGSEATGSEATEAATRVAAGPPTGAGRRRGPLLQGAAALGLALLVLAPLLVSRATLEVLRVQRQVALDADRAAVTIARLVRERGVVPGPSGDPLVAPPAAGYRVLVSRPVQSRTAVTLGLPITVVGPLTPDHRTPGLIHSDLIVFREGLAERSGAVQMQFSGTAPITIDGVRFVPVEVDPANGPSIWASDDP